MNVLNSDEPQADSWTNKMKLTVAYHYFADNLIKYIENKKIIETIPILQAALLSYTHRPLAAHLLCIVRDKNSYFMRMVCYSEFNLKIFFNIYCYVTTIYFLRAPNLLQAKESTVR
jgi:hypothetical protein